MSRSMAKWALAGVAVVVGVGVVAWAGGCGDGHAMAACHGSQGGHAGMHHASGQMGTAPAAGGSSAAAGKPINSTCPIMGGKIDPAHVKPSLTRQFKGQTVAFCCGGCPDQWDKLSDEQKQAKLDKQKAA